MYTSKLITFARQYGPLALVVLLVPGGSLIAGVIYLLRRHAS